LRFSFIAFARAWVRQQATSIAFQQGGSTYVRSFDAKARDVRSVLDYIPASQAALVVANTTAGQDPAVIAAGIQAALDHGATWMPAGTYRVDTPLVLASNACLIGAGRRRTIIQSDIPGDSLFKTAASVAFVYLADLSLRGNGLTGAEGSGHAIDFIDGNTGDSTYSPQQCVVERLDIRNFLGQGRWRDAGASTVAACAVMLYNCLQVELRDVYTSNNGHGVIFDTTQNCRLRNCACDSSTKYALLAYKNENLIIDSCDLVSAGDGVADPGYPAEAFDWGSGIVLSARNRGFVLSKSKMKARVAGLATIQSHYSYGDRIVENWIRGDAQTDVPHKAIYARSTPGLVISRNSFDPAVTPFSATQKYETIELYETAIYHIFSASITENTFGEVVGMGTAYHIKLGGDANTRTIRPIVEGNIFGGAGAAAGPVTIDTDILVKDARISTGRISNNTHVAWTNVTRTAGVTASNVTLAAMKIGPSLWSPNGGTITASYVGISESDLTITSAAFNPPSLAAGASTAIQTTTVVGAALGDTVWASWSASLSGAVIQAWVSAADTVSWFIQNQNGANPLDLASGTATFRVKKAWAA